MIETVTSPVAWPLPPVPWAPALLSSNCQSSVTLPAGSSLLLE
ncbi:MAG: hypothetical protein U5L06_07025 [Rhodovibrio sp.]|nr:hypothetical protein [Rhodovibrio sp.]